MKKILLSIIAGSLLLTSQPTHAFNIKGVSLSNLCLAAIVGGSVAYTGAKFVVSSATVVSKSIIVAAKAAASSMGKHMKQNIIPMVVFTGGAIVACAAAIIFKDQLCDSCCDAASDSSVAVDAAQPQ